MMADDTVTAAVAGERAALTPATAGRSAQVAEAPHPQQRFVVGDGSTGAGHAATAEGGHRVSGYVGVHAGLEPAAAPRGPLFPGGAPGTAMVDDDDDDEEAEGSTDDVEEQGSSDEGDAADPWAALGLDADEADWFGGCLDDVAKAASELGGRPYVTDVGLRSYVPYMSVMEATNGVVTLSSTAAASSHGGRGGAEGRATAAAATAGGGSGSGPPAAPARALYPYQLAGVSWIHALYHQGAGGILADAMGLGKTVQVCAAFTYLRASTGDSDPYLVVCPLSMVGTWVRELTVWCPGARVEVLGDGWTREAAVAADAAGAGRAVVYLTTYAPFERAGGICEYLVAKRFSMLVLDEGHYIKDAASARHQLASIFATRRLLLTGTPLQNSPAELFNLLSFVLPRIFRSEVKPAFERADALYRQHPDTPVVAALRRVVGPFILQRSLEEVRSL